MIPSPRVLHHLPRRFASFTRAVFMFNRFDMSRPLGTIGSDVRTLSVVLREDLRKLGISCEEVDSAISAGCKSVAEATTFIFDGVLPPKPSSLSHQTLARKPSGTSSAPLAYAAAVSNGARHFGPPKNASAAASGIRHADPPEIARKATASAIDEQTRQPQDSDPPHDFTLVVNKSICGKVRGSASEYSSERSKIFCGGLSFDTDEEKLWDYFSDLWTVVDVQVKRDHLTGHPKGFGFVSFAEEDAAKDVSRRRHDIDGRQVEAKIAIPMNQVTPSTVVLRGAGNSGVVERKKGASKRQYRSHLNTAFVAGIPIHVEETDVLAYFGQFGEVSDAQVVKEYATGISCGYGFVSFKEPAVLEEVVGCGKSSKKHSIMGKVFEVKRYEQNSSNGASSSGSSAACTSRERGFSHSPATNQVEENPKKRSTPVNPWKKPDDASTGEARETAVATSVSVAEEPVNNCVICLERPCINAIVPCGHFCLCASCTENIFWRKSRSKEDGKTLCPVCRCEATKVLRIFS